MSDNRKKISLVLGGGGTKGFVHIGVLRYLEEHHYQIQEIIGTSIGSVIGCLVALGKTSHDIETIINKLNNTDIVDLDRKNASLGGQKIINKLQDIIGNRNIEDLPIPFKAVATDLNDGEEVVFDRGPIIEAVRYSISVPGVFSLYDDKRPIVDGGVTNNLPINHASRDRVIAVSCIGYGGLKPPENRQILGVTLPTNPLSYKRDILVRSLLVMLQKMEDLQIKHNPQAQVIRPYTGDISPYDIRVLDQAIQRGYDEASKTLG